MYGPYGDTSYWGIGEQCEHAIAEIMRQSQRKLFWRIRSADRIDLYLAETADVENLAMSAKEEAKYKEESAGCCGNKV